MTELKFFIENGIDKIRLPEWNDLAYAKLDLRISDSCVRAGPIVQFFDPAGKIGIRIVDQMNKGESPLDDDPSDHTPFTQISIFECQKENRWERFIEKSHLGEQNSIEGKNK